MREVNKMNARLSFSPKYCKPVAENAIKPLLLMCNEAMSISSCSKNVLSLVYVWVFQKYTVFNSSSYTNRSSPPAHASLCLL